MKEKPSNPSLKRGTFICFVGIDGSGKTTQAQTLMETLNKSGIRCHYVWARFEPKLTKPFMAIARRLFLHGKDMHSNYADYIKTKRNLSKSRLLSIAYERLLLFDYFFEIFFKVRIPLMQKRVVICDRYIYDTVVSDLAVDLDYSGRKVRSVLERFSRLFPKPALTFLLDVPEEIAYKRKKDIPSMQYLKERRKIYLTVGKQCGMTILDGTKKPGELQNEIENRVFRWNLTPRLLRATGSPFVSEQELPSSKGEALELYAYATKNKIGLLYLEAMKNQGKLDEFQLKSEYEEEQKRHNKQALTARRIAELLNSSSINYAIFKSIMPFPATPNDVDILHFGSDSEYKRAVEIMLRSNYIEVKGKADAQQCMFHDIRDGHCPAPHPQEKDIYDVDLYQKAAASYLIYLDKTKLNKYVTEVNLSGTQVKSLEPEAELVAIITHSIIPEQLGTLFVYYATLHYLATMKSEEISRFIDITKENNVTFPVRVHCSLIAELHQVAHGFVPQEVEEILAGLGDEAGERKNLIKNNFNMPHRYSWLTILRTLLEKAKDGEFRRSIPTQMVHMFNPQIMKWVITQIIVRRRRETY